MLEEAENVLLQKKSANKVSENGFVPNMTKFSISVKINQLCQDIMEIVVPMSQVRLELRRGDISPIPTVYKNTIFVLSVKKYCYVLSVALRRKCHIHPT